MKYLFFCLLSFQTVFALAQYEDPMPAPVFNGMFGKKLVLPAGTPVHLEIPCSWTGEALAVGQSLAFSVKTNVLIENEIAIRSGALAGGRVKSIQPATRNDPEGIEIELQFVQTANGRLIPLTGGNRVVPGKFPGQHANLESGFTLTAHVMNNTEIKVD